MAPEPAALTVQIEVYSTEATRGTYVVNYPLSPSFGPGDLKGTIDAARDRIIASLVGDAATNGELGDDVVTAAAVAQLRRLHASRSPG